MSRAKQPLQHDRFVIPKSRYDSVDCYIADTPSNRPEYNDNDMPIDPKIRDHLVERGMDKLLATHFAHLFIRDPIVIFEETLCQDDEKSSDHFEVSGRAEERSPNEAFPNGDPLRDRTSNRPTGRLSGSSRRLPGRRSAGVSSSGRWKSN